jgi:hypothetical protein
MIPRVMFRLEMLEPLADGRAFERIHTRAVKASLTRELELHHQRRIPRHFEAPARTKYRYAERKPGWKIKKMNVWGSRTDLVASGRTRRAMLSQYRLTVSGSVANGMVGTLRMRFPFPASFENSSNRVSLEQMAREIATITADEAQDIAASFKANYVRLIKDALATSPRLRKRIGATA